MTENKIYRYDDGDLIAIEDHAATLPHGVAVQILVASGVKRADLARVLRKHADLVEELGSDESEPVN